MRTGVLVHGCNLKAENWRHVAWGDPPNMMGRLPQGILMALRFDAEAIVFGTGASRKSFRFTESEVFGQELLEAEYSLEYLKLHFDDLERFKPFVELMKAKQIQNIRELSEKVFDRLHLDVRSMNTFEEIENAGHIFLQLAVDQLILVSSPTHIVRCLRDATAIFRPNTILGRFCDKVLASPSITCYEGTTGRDVVVVEPPHRPDRHVIPTHRRIQRMMELQKLHPDDLVQLIEEFDDLLQKFENRYHTMNRKSDGAFSKEGLK